MKIKAEQRESKKHKQKVKEKMGGTLAGQIARTQTAKQYEGKKNKKR